MKVAITGATGFIGKLLLEKHLEQGDDVNILSRRELIDLKTFGKAKCYKGDLHSTEILENFLENVVVLYHCAAEINDEAMMYKTNVEGTRNLINAAKNRIKHWVQLSSVGVYGPINKGTVFENQEYNPINTYEKTKLQSDLLVIEASKEHYFTNTIIRPSIVFGAGMKNNSLFQLIKAIDMKRFFFVGQKGASANYVSAINVVQSLLLAGGKMKAENEVYIISHWVTIEYFIQCIAKELGKPFPKLRIPLFLIKSLAFVISFIPKNPLTISRINALSSRAIYSNSKIEADLGYKPVIELEDSIKHLVKKYIVTKQ